MWLYLYMVKIVHLVLTSSQGLCILYTFSKLRQSGMDYHPEFALMKFHSNEDFECEWADMHDLKTALIENGFPCRT